MGGRGDVARTTAQFLAQRGLLSLEVTVEADNGAVGVATPESGVSTGIYEAAFGNPFSTSAAMVSVGRVGALLIHCCTASLTALGLWEWISQRRARWFFLSLGLSMGLHAAWNALAISLSAAMTMDAAAALTAQVIALAGLGLLSLGAAYVLARITRPQAGPAT